jgi:hypothetical protein
MFELRQPTNYCTMQMPTRTDQQLPIHTHTHIERGHFTPALAAEVPHVDHGVHHDGDGEALVVVMPRCHSRSKWRWSGGGLEGRGF